MAINAFEPGTFVTILILTFTLFLVITGAFTAYFGSGKSRRIGLVLLVGGLAGGLFWGWFSSGLGIGLLPTGLFEVIVQSIIVIVAAAIGAILAIGLFLLAIMKS